jgi:hypothetical protein
MIDVLTAQNVIGRLRVVGAGTDALSARLRAETLLNSVSLDAAQTTPSAIVFIRKVRDPLPGVLNFDSSRPSMEWNRALAAALRDIAAKAIRPAIDNASGNEQAVIFADRAELLACLAADLCRDRIQSRWWWASCLAAGDLQSAVARMWRDNPEYVPAALDQLARAKTIAGVVARFTDAQARELTTVVMRKFGLPTLTNIPPFAQEVTASTVAEPFAEIKSPFEASTFEQRLKTPPWTKHVPEASAAPQLSIDQQRFVGIALMIHRAPSIARTTKFARELQRWEQQIVYGAPPPVALREDSGGLFAVPATVTQTEKAPAESARTQRSATPVESFRQSPSDVDATPMAAAKTQTSSIPSPTTPNLERAPDQSFADPESPLTAPNLESARSESPATNVPTTATSQTNDAVADATPIESIAVDDAPAIHIETHLGGLFYLISLALYLELYSDFTSPTAQGLELNIWDFITLVGRELAGNEYDDDPIWVLLASLACREEGEPAGKHFKPESDWRLPREWLRPFKEDQSWKWSASRGRLRVLHPAGFALLDLPLSGDPHDQLQREIESYGIPIESLSRTRLPRPSSMRSKITRPSLRRWLSRLVPYVRARLRIALGVESNEEITTTLCRRRATVRVTDTHVDVFFALSDLPLEIRFAGLDRDPGWVPAAGRFIAFHFD